MQRRIVIALLSAAAVGAALLVPSVAQATDASPSGSGPRQETMPSWRADSPDAAAVPLTAASRVCTLTCDGDAVTPTADATPVAAAALSGRTLTLHTSIDQGISWGRLAGARSGDRVWVERSLDAGATREQPLAPVSASGAGIIGTPPVNIADPSNHRRGIVRACASVGSTSICTGWAYRTSVDGSVKDGSAPATSVDQQTVPAATTAGRVVRLHVGANSAAWAGIEKATAGDTVWIERSWNAGTSSTGGALGRVTVASGATTASTAAYVAAEPRLKLYGGSVRACERAASTQATVCTAWARPAVNKLAAATDALAYDYDPYTAWWPSSWWNSAVAITTVIDYQRQTGDPTYAWMIDRTFEVNKGTFAAGVKSGDALPGGFVSRAIDDGMWWGLAWIRAYDLTGDAKYLQMSESIGNYTYGYWDDTCGGGVWWNAERTYKNAVVNGQFIRLAAELHQRIPGDHDWLNRAVDGWNWYQKVGMAGSDNLVNDGITDACVNNGQTVWTYNQGLAIGDGVELYRATGDSAYLTRSETLADAATKGAPLTVNGILTESCDVQGAQNPCDDNQKQFKGIFERYLQDLNDATSGRDAGYANRQAASVWTKDRDALNRLGARWSGASYSGSPNVRDWRTQASGLSALLAQR